MLRINLLPPYIYDKQKKIQLAAVWALGVAAVVVAFVLWIGSLNRDLEAATKEKETAESLKNKYTSLEGQIQKVQADNNATKQKQDFIRNARAFNEAWPRTFEMMRDLTSDTILLKSLSVNPNDRKTLNFNGFARNEMLIVRWWMQLRKRNDIFDKVHFNLPADHGFQPAAPAAVAGGSFGGPAAPGAPVPGRDVPVVTAAATAGGSNPYGGYSGAPGSGQAGDVGPGVIEGRNGVHFSADATLKTQLAGGIPVPSWPPAAAAQPGGFPGVPNSYGGGSPDAPAPGAPLGGRRGRAAME